MSEVFDAYHKWLGIAPEEQPPHYYRLLAINVFETDPDVIAGAADQRMAHLRSFQAGKYSSRSQEILNEIAAARICLLNAEKKVEYDRQLYQRLAVQQHQRMAAATPPAVPAAPSDAGYPPAPLYPAAGPAMPQVGPYEQGSLSEADLGMSGELAAASPTRRRQQKKKSRAPLVGIAATVVVAAGIGAVLLWTFRGGDAPSDHQPRVAESKHAEPPDVKAQPAPAATAAASAKAAPTEPSDPAANPGSPWVTTPASPVPPPVASTQKVPVPDAAAQAQAEERLKTTLAGTSAANLLDAALADNLDPAERYVMLKKAQELAVGAGDVAVAMEALDETAKRYDCDLLDRKLETLVQLSKVSRGAEARVALAENGLLLVDQALAGGKKDVALRSASLALGAARKTGKSDLIRRVTISILKMRKPE